jgi:hypothetical protein
MLINVVQMKSALGEKRKIGSLGLCNQASNIFGLENRRKKQPKVLI